MQWIKSLDSWTVCVLVPRSLPGLLLHPVPQGGRQPGRVPPGGRLQREGGRETERYIYESSSIFKSFDREKETERER